jgi:hypothetical protein
MSLLGNYGRPNLWKCDTLLGNLVSSSKMRVLALPEISAVLFHHRYPWPKLRAQARCEGGISIKEPEDHDLHRMTPSTLNLVRAYATKVRLFDRPVGSGASNVLSCNQIRRFSSDIHRGRSLLMDGIRPESEGATITREDTRMSVIPSSRYGSPRPVKCGNKCRGRRISRWYEGERAKRPTRSIGLRNSQHSGG